MKLIQTEVIGGVRIGRRVITRKDKDGNTTERTTKHYYAEYRDTVGRRRFESLSTTNKREARRLAVDLESRVERGGDKPANTKTTIQELVQEFMYASQLKNLAPKTLAKYKAETDKLLTFCAEHGIADASKFDERAYLELMGWLRGQTHKQHRGYASKTLYTTLTVIKQAFRWAHEQELIPENPIQRAKLPRGRSNPQRCFTTEQVEAMLLASHAYEGFEQTHDAIAILAYTGMRVGELIQLRWEDVHFDRGQHGNLWIRRGGSGETTKDMDDRILPIHPRVNEILKSLPRSGPLVMPGLSARTLLTRVKRLCKELRFGDGYKTHSLRHHFVSMCASRGVPMRLCLEWVGHSSSEILNLYYTLHDRESEEAMSALVEINGTLGGRGR